MKQHQLVSRYRREMMMSLALYVLLLTCTIKFGRPMADSALRTMLLASPMLGFLGMIWAIARHVRSIDEYLRQFMLETWAIAAGLTAAATFSYGFLETAGFPPVSMFAVWMIMCGAWAIVCMGRYALKR